MLAALSTSLSYKSDRQKEFAQHAVIKSPSLRFRFFQKYRHNLLRIVAQLATNCPIWQHCCGAISNKI